VPVPRDEGVEFFLLQFNYHQVMFTSLLEFKTKGEEARPYLTITHYPELISIKDIVLMKGEITDTKLLSIANAQYLAFVLQQFYVTGGASKIKLLETFHCKPQEFDYNDVIKEMETVV
jgi:ATP synthase F1 complex assembly factor 1